MNERLLLTSANCSLRRTLESEGFRVHTWPTLQIQPVEMAAALDEAIENLFGYDWIIFVHQDAVGAFLQRLGQREREVSDLDTLRVCAVGEVTATELEHARVHVDVVTANANPSVVVEQLATFAGGTLDRLNFLLPQAAIGREYLKEHIESTGARVDVVATYQTVAGEDLTRLVSLQSMLVTGSVDAVVFANASEVRELARVFDTHDLSTLLRKTLVITSDDDAANAIRAAGISEPLQSSPDAIIESLATRLRT